MPEQNEIVGRINLPEGQQAGVLADFANVWHTDNYFVIDYMAQQGPIHSELINGVPQNVQDSTVVARVKVLPEQILPLIKALQDQSNHWIKQHNKFGGPEEIGKN